MNGALTARLTGEAGVSILDVYGIGTAIAANPAAFGFTNVTDACGAVAGADCSKYTYWDGIHPTTAVHAAVANAMLVAAIPEPETYALFAAGLAFVAWRSKARARTARALAQQLEQRARDHLGRAAQVLEHEVLVGALGVRLEHRARAGAVDRGRHARLAVQAHVGVERRPRGRDRFAEHRLAVALQRLDQRPIAGQRLQRVGEQQPLDVDLDARDRGRGLGDDRADRRPRPRPGLPPGSSGGRA